MIEEENCIRQSRYTHAKLCQIIWNILCLAIAIHISYLLYKNTFTSLTLTTRKYIEQCALADRSSLLFIFSDTLLNISDSKLSVAQFKDQAKVGNHRLLL